MRLDLTAIFQNHGSSLPFDAMIDFSDVDVDGVFPFSDKIHVFGQVKNVAGAVILSLSAHGFADTVCDRCLKEIRVELNADVQYYLTLNECDDSDSVIAVENGMLDVYSIAYDIVLLEFLQKHLCSEDCKGLCGVCGANLNFTKCECDKKQVDPRLSILAQLLEE